jgi:outer membrane translocation and assembly module TamA
VLPLRWGLTAFGESGRVWYADESSKRWHAGYGGGVMAQLIGTPMALGASIASGTEGIRFYFSGGYSF